MSGSTHFLWAAVHYVPWLVIWLMGVVFAAARWQRHPRVSALVVTACVLSFIAMAVGTVGVFLLARFTDFTPVNRLFVVVPMVTSLLNATSIGILLFAAMVDRGVYWQADSKQVPPIREEVVMPTKG